MTSILWSSKVVKSAVLFTALSAVPLVLIVEGLFAPRERRRLPFVLLALGAGFVMGAPFDPSRFTWLTTMLVALAALLVRVDTLIYAVLPRMDAVKAAGFSSRVRGCALAVPLAFSDAAIQFWFFVGLAVPEICASFWMLISPATQEREQVRRRTRSSSSSYS